MDLPLADLIEPIADDMPCGEDPAMHDNVFQSLQQAIKGRVEYKLIDGDEAAIYHPPVWEQIYEDALQCASRTRDIRVCIMLLRGAAGSHGLSGLVSGLHLLKETCAGFWHQLYPALDDEADSPEEAVFARVAALGELTNRQGLLRDLQDIPILEARGIGKFGLRAINLARGSFSPAPGEAVSEIGLIEAALAQDPNLSDTLALIDAARREFDQLNADLGKHLSQETPDLSPLRKVFDDMAGALGGDRAGADQTGGEQAGGDQAAAAAAASSSDSQASAPTADGGGAGAGELRTREHVIAALDRIIDYYNRHEPASPIPLLIKRARRLVPMDFLALMEDLAPTSVKQLKELGGVVKGGAAAKEKKADDDQ